MECALIDVLLLTDAWPETLWPELELLEFLLDADAETTTPAASEAFGIIVVLSNRVIFKSRGLIGLLCPIASRFVTVLAGRICIVPSSIGR